MLKQISMLRFSILCLALSVAIPVFALGWSDEEWLNAGCPADMAGNWIPRDEASAGNTLLTVNSNQIKFASEAGDQKTIAFAKEGQPNGSTILNLSESDLSGAKKTFAYLPYWKVRPHLVLGPVISDNALATPSPCLIKVFRYRYQDQIAGDKYVSWDIYFIK